VPDRRRHREVRRHTYIQHNPQVADGKQAFIDYFVRTANDYPGKRAEFKRAFADGNHVILHCHHVWPGNLEYAGTDIFRFDDAGRIVEHWDALQVIPQTAARPTTPCSDSRDTAHGRRSSGRTEAVVAGFRRTLDQ
jgi:predicted SnoaL-like aldol condensation-catalyzing enzyme